MKKSTLLHLRVPFSFYLLSVFLFAVASTGITNNVNAAIAFFVLHFLIYPASNGYNSYFDKDEESIGSLEHPPKVTGELYWVSLALDLIALVLGLFISIEFAILILIYGLVSKAYSHPNVRLKKYPVSGWLSAGIFQGYFTFLVCIIAITDLNVADVFSIEIQLPAILSSILLLGSYPMTQIYQHNQDAKRGDLTLSRLLGIIGTFHFTALLFSISMVGFGYYFLTRSSIQTTFLFYGLLSPVLGYFFYWYWITKKDVSNADFNHTMRFNFLSSLMFNIFFFSWWLI